MKVRAAPGQDRPRQGVRPEIEMRYRVTLALISAQSIAPDIKEGRELLPLVSHCMADID